MLSANNLLKPMDGNAVTVPSQDMVLGSYYLTIEREGAPTSSKRRPLALALATLAVLALLVFLFAIRDAVEQIRRQAVTVYEVARAAHTGYEWLAGKVSLFLKLREELRKE